MVIFPSEQAHQLLNDSRNVDTVACQNAIEHRRTLMTQTLRP